MPNALLSSFASGIAWSVTPHRPGLSCGTTWINNGIVEIIGFVAR